MKKLLALICAAALSFTLTGCNALDGNIDTLLNPPAPTGQMGLVQGALKKSVKTKFTLKYPTNGDYRSAFIIKDLDGDGVQEAIALYSTTLDNTTNMHINLITNNGEEWTSRGSSSIVATGVEKVDFADINGDGKLEVIVGWSVYGSVEKRLSVYVLDSNGITSRIQESYSSYICRDFTKDNTLDVLIISKDSANSTASAKLIDLTSEGAEELGSCALDPAVSEYRTPVIFELDGRTAIYLDGTKGAGTITEMLLVDEGLINLSYNEDSASHFDTFRTGNTPISDVNGDGNYEIPISYLLTQAVAGTADNIYKTNWYCYNGAEFVMTLSAVTNQQDGYYLEIPEKWDGAITVTSNTTERLRTIFRLNTETGTSAEELVRIWAISKENGLIPTFEGSFKIAENDKFTYYAALGSYTGKEAITKDELKELFNLII